MRAKKRGRKPPKSPALRIASIAILTAATAVLTWLVRIPIPATAGYFNLSDTMVYFTAFTLGPVSALLTGGLGTAIADLLGAYYIYSPISLFVHGLQGLVAALIAAIPLAGKRSRWPFNPSWLIAVVAGTVVMCGGYLAAESVIKGFGAALVELPFNLLQNLVGAVVSISLSLAVRKAYPPVLELRW
jgi:uncharacterized membrane protein